VGSQALSHATTKPIFEVVLLEYAIVHASNHTLQFTNATFTGNKCTVDGGTLYTKHAAFVDKCALVCMPAT
jgi:predicted outer membrane repeat protein